MLVPELFSRELLHSIAFSTLEKISSVLPVSYVRLFCSNNIIFGILELAILAKTQSLILSLGLCQNHTLSLDVVFAK